MQHLSKMCISPITKRNDPGLLPAHFPLPCGRCHECLHRRAQGWIFRIEQEAKSAYTAQFITLTYDDDKLPLTQCVDKDGVIQTMPTLVKTHFQDFIKRLRKLNVQGIKYYACGEYGSRTVRPHYHAILLNAHIDTIKQAWTDGHIQYGTVKPNSIAYTVKYMQKGSILGQGKYTYQVDTRQKEFSLMSKKMGLSYITSSIIKWHKADLLNRCYIQKSDGTKIAMPRYFKEKIYSQEELIKINSHIKIEKTEEQYEKELDPDHFRVDADRKRIKLNTIQNNLKNKR